MKVYLSRDEFFPDFEMITERQYKELPLTSETSDGTWLNQQSVKKLTVCIEMSEAEYSEFKSVQERFYDLTAKYKVRYEAAEVQNKNQKYTLNIDFAGS